MRNLDCPTFCNLDKSAKPEGRNKKPEKIWHAAILGGASCIKNYTNLVNSVNFPLLFIHFFYVIVGSLGIRVKNTDFGVRNIEIGVLNDKFWVKNFNTGVLNTKIGG
jgi:hypothetical protein